MKKIILALIPILYLQLSATAQAPANDECTGAFELKVANNFTLKNQTTVGATESYDYPYNCQFYDVWYHLTTLQAGVLNMNITDVEHDWTIFLYQASSFNCNGGGGPEPTALVTANQFYQGLSVPGNTKYYLRVRRRYCNSVPLYEPFTIRVTGSSVALAVNNDCSGAKTVTYNTTLANQNNLLAGASPTPPASCNGIGAGTADDDVWFKFTTVTNNGVVVRVKSTNGKDPVIFLYKSCGDGAVPEFCANTPGNQETIFTRLDGNTTYYIRVYNYFTADDPVNGGQMDFDVTVKDSAFAANDNCNAGTFVAMNTILTNQSNMVSSPSTNPAQSVDCNGLGAGTADDDVWFNFNIQANNVSGTVVRVISTNGIDPVLFLYEDCNANSVPVACANTPGTRETIWKKLQAGVNYRVRVYSWAPGTDPVNGGLMNFSIEVKDSAFAVNDEPCGAIALTYNNATGINTTTVSSTKTTSIARPLTCSTDANGTALGTGTTGNENDVWYKFTYVPGMATATTTPGMVVRVRTLDPANTDPVFFLYSGTDCNALTLYGCSNTAGDLENMRVRDIPAGTTSFYVRVHEYSNKPMPFTIVAKDTIFAGNDRCDGVSSVAYNIPFNVGLTNQNNRNTTGPIVNQYPNNVSSCSGIPSPTSYAEDDSWFRFTPLTTTAYVSVRSTNNFNIYAGSTPLPISLGSFTGEHGASVNVLRWTSLTEVNNASFELQRSTNSTYYNTITTLLSKATGGNSTTAINYDYTDGTPAPGINYYRLKQTDKDGKTTLSPIVQLKGVVGKMLTLLGVYPNPASDAVSVNITSPIQQPITLIVTDIAGKIVKQQTEALPAGEKTFSMNVAALQPGSYFIKAVCNDGCQSQYLRFSKN